MAASPQPTDKEGALRVMQIIAGALMMGVVVFGAIVVVRLAGREENAASPEVISYVAAGASLLALVVVAIVPTSLGQTADSRATPEEKELAKCAAYQTRLIIRFAILEGVAMLNLVAAMIDGQVFNVAIAGAMVLCMALLFPTRGRLEAYVKGQSQLDDLPEMR